MRQYEVQPGDTPASIAAQPHMAGCPKCSVDLIRVNPHKPTMTMPNGFVTFRDLRAGERLNLPDKWFDGTLDKRPKAYFTALPYPDGVTPSKLGVGAAGVLADFATLDAATAKVSQLAQLANTAFQNAVDSTGTLIDQAVQEADASTNPGIKAYAQAVHIATNDARQRSQDLSNAIIAGDTNAATAARLAIQNDLLTAIDSANLALQTVYVDIGPAVVDPSASFPAAIATAAKVAATAIAADPGFCASVAQPGSPVNAAVHAFKLAWNATQSTQVPIGTGTYDQATADAITKVLGSAPPACGAQAAPPLSPPQPPPINDMPIAVTPPKKGVSVGAIASLAVLGATAVGGAIYYATRPRPVRVRRVRTSTYAIRGSS